MNQLARIKCASPLFVIVDEIGLVPVEVRPIPPLEFERQENLAMRYVLAMGGVVVGDGLGELQIERQCRLVSSATGMDLDRIRQLTMDGLSRLFAVFLNVQKSSLGNFAEWIEEIKKLIHTDPIVSMDGARTMLSIGPSDFYGCPVSELTDGQLVYFSAVKSAYDEAHSDGGETKRSVSKKWLQGEIN